MTDLDMDDLNGNALSAIKKHWDQKYIISEEENEAF